MLRTAVRPAARFALVATRDATACAMSTAAQVSPKAAFVVIGNEILSGKIQDTNTHALASRLFSQGVDLVRVEVIPDDIETIGASVRNMSELVGPSGFVFTSGGIGSTHDDVTYEAKAFGTATELHQPTLDKMRLSVESRGQSLNEARKRMAILPHGCDILSTDGLWVPLCIVGNVHILPGVPKLFERMIDAHLDRFRGVRATLRVLYCPVPEGDISDAMREIAGRYDAVDIGSYPQMAETNPDGSLKYTTRVTAESRDAEALERAVAELRAAIPSAELQ